MIGLIKPVGNTFTNNGNYNALHWLSYCATCKAIGSEYGQLYRAGLNYDLAFLGQLVSDLAHIETDSSKIKPRHCFARPEYSENHYKLMQYISALHLFWYKVKINDNAKDEKNRIWRFLNTKGNETFKKAVNKAWR